MSTFVSIDRSSLSLDPLLIEDDGDGPYNLEENGLGRPIVTLRNTYADVSADVASQLLLQSVRDISALPLTIIVDAVSTAALENALQALADALFQFSYTTTVSVDGFAQTWNCQPTAYQAADTVTRLKIRDHQEVVNVTIPVDPVPVD